MMFGLAEEENEGEKDLISKVEEVLIEIGEKPRVSATRIGTKPKTTSNRPVKITVGSSVVVAQILAKARFLSKSKKNSRVYISPDRSPTQRIEHRSLVQSLKEKRLNDPSKKHYISDGRIISADKT